MSEQSAKPYLIRAICEWCADNGHALAGPCWEVYDHMTEGPAQQPRTDVFYLLRPAAETPRGQ